MIFGRFGLGAAGLAAALLVFLPAPGAAQAVPAVTPGAAAAPGPAEAESLLVVGGYVNASGHPVADAIVRVNAPDKPGPDDALTATRSDADGSYSMLVSVPRGVTKVYVFVTPSSVRQSDTKRKTLSKLDGPVDDGTVTRPLDFDIDTDLAFSPDPNEATPAATPPPPVRASLAPVFPASGDFASPPSGTIEILFNDRHVYAKPDRETHGRVIAALVRRNTILVPLRSMFEQIGATVGYEPAKKTVTVSKPGSVVAVTVDVPTVTINGETRPLDVPPEIDHGVLLVPIRVLAEAMGAYVEWVPKRHIVVIRFILAAAPPPPPPRPTPAASPTPALNDTVVVHYATNRKRAGATLAPGTTFGDTKADLSYGIAKVRVTHDFNTPLTNEAQTAIDFVMAKDVWKDVSIFDVANVQPDQFFALTTPDMGTTHDVLLLVHGFNVSFDTSIKAGAVLKRVSGFDGGLIVFSWPAKAPVKPWEIAKAYDANQITAKESVGDLVTVLEKMARSRSVHGIRLIAHSMGNRILLAALERIQQSAPPEVRSRYQAAYVAMVAADVSHHDFCTSLKALHGFVQFANVVSALDVPLKLSYRRDKRHRVGEGSALSLLLPHADGFTLDASASKSNFPWHGYLWDNRDLAHAVLALFRGPDPARATAVNGYYAFEGDGATFAAPPPLADDQRCRL